MTKKYDVVATVGEYQDRQTGEMKKRYKNVGAVIQTQHGHALLLDKTFSPAGLAEPGRESVLLSLFEPRQDSRKGQPTGDQQRDQGGGGAPGGGPSDDIPFAPLRGWEWMA